MKLTPMLQQYLRIKSQHQDAILLFRLGDFYEMFFEDAEIASRILDITLTSRQRGEGDKAIPLCGVPFHAVEPYVAKLLAAGWKVAICEQREGAKRTLMDREVVRIVTQGTVLDEASLEPGRPNYLAAVAARDGAYGLAVVEFSTGAITVTEVSGLSALLAELNRLAIRELVLPTTMDEEGREALRRGEWAVSETETDPSESQDASGKPDMTREAVSLVHGYLKRVYRGGLDHLQEAEAYECADFLKLDGFSQRNLELVATFSGERRGSLLWVLDQTGTAMGARTIRSWLLAPLLKREAIGRRLDAVEELVNAVGLRQAIADGVKGIGDFERIGGRVGARTATPRDLKALEVGLERVAKLRSTLSDASAPLLVELAEALDPLHEVRDAINRSIDEDPPANLRGGSIIRSGYHPEVDELRRLTLDGRGWIARLEARERDRTGISSLKVRYNRVFGYYIEISRANLGRVPEDYERKQTLVGSERFVTPELKEYEAKVLGAEERLRALEVGLFEELVGRIVAHQKALAATARSVGAIDALASLAEVAHKRGYVRPEIRRKPGVSIKEGRHPVVEALAPSGEAFVPNDCTLSPDGEQIVLITGPNMAGKSTFLRQTALIVILAQVGSFVPATEAEIGIFDRVFTRVGAADNLSAGESTFMVEMREAASILDGLTERSLVILDEIGRGTSTFDGISIAWAMVEYLHDHPTAKALTLFATHYHELTELAVSHSRVRNASAAVREWNDEVVFLRRVMPGPANRSYGIEVARLAGVPASVVARARQILAALEREGRSSVRDDLSSVGAQDEGPSQASLFEAAGVRLQRELAALDVDRLTPLEALNYVGHLVEIARSRS